MRNKNTLTKGFIALLVTVLFIAPGVSYADWGGHHDGGHRYYGWHEHPHWGYHVHYLPHGYFSIWVGGARYYYYDGLYYDYVGGDYVIVNPPMGAVVATIPSDFQPVIVNGTTYYVDNGTYYLYTPHGYQLVTPPTAVVQPAAVVTAPPVVAQGFFTVNIPNNSGGYTPVVIKRSGNGYLGPQGEFYPQFPKVAQLKVMYGR